VAEEVVEVIEEMEEEEALWEHLNQLVKCKHKLLSQQQLVNYHRYLMEQGLKQMLSSKKLKPTSESIKMLQNLTLPLEKSLSPSPLSKDLMLKDGYVIWESELIDSIPLMTISLMCGPNSYTNSEYNSKMPISSNNYKWNSKSIGCNFYMLKIIS
jgi:hypothetical protein